MVTFDMDNMIDELIDKEVEYCEDMGKKFYKISDVDDIHDRMLSLTVEDSYGDIVTIEDLNDNDYKIFKKELKSLTKEDINSINDKINEELHWKDEIPNFAWRNK